MYKQRISYADYVEEVERLYKIERREIYFGFVIRDFIQSILTESEQLVAVWDNKGYKDDTKNPLRFLYKGIIIKHNKTSQPTLKRRYFFVKSDVFLWPGLRKEW